MGDITELLSEQVGAGQVADLLGRINEEVLFGQTTPQDGAERFISEAATITG